MMQCEPLEMELQMNEISFLISLAWAEGGIDVGDPMLKIDKCCEGDRSAHASEVSKLISSHLAFHDKSIQL